MSRKKIPPEALISLRSSLESLPMRSPERKKLIEKTASLYCVSSPTVYRYLKEHSNLRPINRSDSGVPRVLSQKEMEYYCELIAAIKVGSTNKKSRHLSTGQAIYLLENQGIETPELVKLPKSLLKKSTVNHYLKKWGYNYKSLYQQPPAVRFQANHSNDCWQFDISPSDLKYIKYPSWSRDPKNPPKLMIYSIVDDRSGVVYSEYHCTYGEDVEAALRFLFNAMSAKKDKEFSFQGIPKMIYMDNGPIYQSRIFRQVMEYLGINAKSHMPRGKDGQRTTARSKGKIERPFRSLKEMLETLYHFKEPETPEEANNGLHKFLLRYNSMQHRSEPHSRMEDWVAKIPKEGITKMCNWERFSTFAREKESRKVASDSRISVNGIYYEVDPNLAGETVIFLWGLFDNELYVDFNGKKYGPYTPVEGPIPLHKYRKFEKTKNEERFSRISELARKLRLPNDKSDKVETNNKIPMIDLNEFVDPDPFNEFSFTSIIEAKKEIANYLRTPLAKLGTEKIEEIHKIVENTLVKEVVMQQVCKLFPSIKGKYYDQ